MYKDDIIKKLEEEGYKDVAPCPLPPTKATGSHTHDVDTMHVILSGELEITNKAGVKVYKEGDRIEFAKGTKHSAKSIIEGEMVVGHK